MNRLLPHGLGASVLAAAVFLAVAGAFPAPNCVHYADYPHWVTTLSGIGYDDIVIYRDWALVCAGSAGLQLLDISNPRAPVLVAAWHGYGAVRAITVCGNLAFVGDCYSGAICLRVFDLDGLPNFALLRTVCGMAGDATDLAVGSGYLYMTAGAEGLHVFSLADPTQPIHVGRYLTAPAARAVAVRGGYAYVADDTWGLRIFDLTNPAVPQLIRTVDTPGNALDVLLWGELALLGDGSSGVELVDIRDPGSAAIIGSVDTRGEAVGLALLGTTLCVADGSGGFHLVDVTDPRRPSVRWSTSVGWGQVVTVQGNSAFVGTSWSWLLVIDLGNRSPSPVLGTYMGSGEIVDLAVAGKYAYAIFQDPPRLDVLSLSNPETPSVVGSLPGDYYQIEVQDTVGVAAGWNHMYVFNLADPTRPRVLARVRISETGMSNGPVRLAICPGFAFVTNHEEPSGWIMDWLHVVDISVPEAPVVLGRWEAPDWAFYYAPEPALAFPYVYVTGELTYVDRCLYVLDVSDPHRPTLVNTIVGAAPIDMAIQGHHLFAADYGALCVYDLEDPALPVLIAQRLTPGNPRSIAASWPFVYVGDNGSESVVFDVTNPAEPSLLGSWEWTGGGCRDVAVRGHLLVAAEPDSGLVIRPVECPRAPGCLPRGAPALASRLGISPTPSRGATRVDFTLPAAGETDLAIYDVTGRRVRRLAAGALPAGPHAILWDGRSDDGRPSPPGIYFARLTAGGAEAVGRIVLLP